MGCGYDEGMLNKLLLAGAARAQPVNGATGLRYSRELSNFVLSLVGIISANNVDTYRTVSWLLGLVPKRILSSSSFSTCGTRTTRELVVTR